MVSNVSNDPFLSRQECGSGNASEIEHALREYSQGLKRDGKCLRRFTPENSESAVRVKILRNEERQVRAVKTVRLRGQGPNACRFQSPPRVHN